MQAAIIVAIVFGSIIIILAIAASTVLLAIKTFKGGASGKSRQQAAEETKMIQEIYQGLSVMEKRIETLETLLLEKERKDKQPWADTTQN